MAAIQPYPNRQILFDRKLITTVWRRNGKIDFIVNNFVVADLNNDKHNELVFIFNAGYSRQPRGIFSYDFFNDTIISSKSIGAHMLQLQIVDIDNDSYPEIFCGSCTTGNISDSMGVPYSDYYSWYFGFNNKLEPLFTPIKHQYYPSSVDICRYKNHKGENFIAASFCDNKNKTQIVKFFGFDNSITSEIKLSKPQDSESNVIILMKDVIINYINYVLIGIWDDEFILTNEKQDIIKIPKVINADKFNSYIDLNKDNKKEFVFVNPEFDYVIYDENLRNPAILRTNITPSEVSWSCTGVKHNGNKQDEFYIKTDNYLSLYTYKLNYLYYLKYPIWIVVYGIIVLILWFSQRIQNIQLQHKRQIEDTINSLQIKTIKSQMDPHFMFNVLNGLANNVAKGNSKEAHNQILRFSILLRSLMKRTDKIDISLGKEIEFITSYLELEKFRFKDDFEFSIEIEKSVDQNIRIPSMLIQLVVENSIKHGLRNKEGIKKLDVNILCKEKKTLIIIEDNGVGREEALKKTRDTGKGTKLINDMINLNRKLGGKEISVNYTDLYDATGQALGTRVEVEI